MPEDASAQTPPEVEAFIARWHESGGAEIANYQLLVTELCDMLGVERPQPTHEDQARNDYVLERSVAFRHMDGSATMGRIDCYKRDCFILEAKQSGKRDAARPDTATTDMFGEPAAAARKTGHARRGTGTWDTVMRAARQQAESYARALPIAHGYPPFLLVVDVGHVVEVFADFSGQGKNYAHFPDKHGQLTMTGLYNVLERVRELETGAEVAPLSAKEQDIYEAGLVGVLKEIHDDIDRAVLRAYGWADLIDPMVGRPGATTPSPHKSAEQEAAEQDLLGRLVALNQDRAAEEARGHVRWLRPEFQIPKLGHKIPEPAAAEQTAAELAPVASETKPAWPRDGMEQIRRVHEVLADADAPVTAEAVARSFQGRLTTKKRERVEQVLATLVTTGAAQTPPDNPNAFFVAG